MASERGMVKFFDEREGKRFGFLLVLSEDGVPTGEELFFHYNDGEFQNQDGAKPIFFGSTKAKDDKVIRLRVPQKDEILVFQRADGRKGDKASPWGYASRYDGLVEWLNNRPLIRVVETLTTGIREPRSEESILWEGQNVYELSSEYPKRAEGTHFAGRTGNDSLGYFSHDDGFSYRREFQTIINGQWTKINDPRVYECCVPEYVFRRFCSPGYKQTWNCYHRNSLRNQLEALEKRGSRVHA